MYASNKQRIKKTVIRPQVNLEKKFEGPSAVSYTHLRAHETELHLVCRLLLAYISKQELTLDIDEEVIEEVFEEPPVE